MISTSVLIRTTIYCIVDMNIQYFVYGLPTPTW